MGSTKSPRPKTARQEEQRLEHAPSSQRIRLGRPNSRSPLQLWSFTANLWKRAKTSQRILATKNWLLYHDNAPSYASFVTREFFYQKQDDRHSSSIVFPWLPPLRLFSFSPIEDVMSIFLTLLVTTVAFGVPCESRLSMHWSRLHLRTLIWSYGTKTDNTQVSNLLLLRKPSHIGL